MKKLDVVALGGGTGLSTLLKGLKLFSDVNITAIVTVTDEGGSSGVIREELGILPPGDIRNNIVALAEDESLMAKVMSYRFNDGKTFKNHSLGNLIIAALTKITGDFATAIERLSDTLAIKGTVLPVTEDKVRLVAKMSDGKSVVGEMNIVKANKKIVHINLDKEAKAYPKVIEAIIKSDVAVLGPGSLYTSIIPNVLVDEVRENLNKKPRIFIANLMTQPGETNNFTLEDHVRVLEKYLKKPVEKIIVNNEKVPSNILKKYQKKGATAVLKGDFNDDRIVEAPLMSLEIDPNDKNEKIRHDPVKLANLVRKVALELMKE